MREGTRRCRRRILAIGRRTWSRASAALNSSHSRDPDWSRSNSRKTQSRSSDCVSPRCTSSSCTRIATSIISLSSHAARKASPTIVIGIVVKMSPARMATCGSARAHGPCSVA